METLNIILCGLGGQGILFMTKVMAQAALDQGFDVIGAETHGMAQRGGSVVSHLRIGPAKSSLVRAGTARLVLALEENEAYRNLPFIAPGGGMVVNADPGRFPAESVRPFIAEKGIACRSVPAGDLAMELGARLSTNLALLGFFSAFSEAPMTHDALRKTIERISPDRFRPLNLKVFDSSYRSGVESEDG